MRSEDAPLFNGGDAFRYTHPNKDKHPWVVVSDSFQNLTHVAAVNFTKWLKWKDQTCVVDASDCPGILTVRSCIEYAGGELLRPGHAGGRPGRWRRQAARNSLRLDSKANPARHDGFPIYAEQGSRLDDRTGFGTRNLLIYLSFFLTLP